MQGKAVIKVPQGKLLKIEVECDESVLVNVKICGDFFFHPEEELEHLEQLLRYHPLDKELIRYMIDAFIKQNNVEMHGITVSALVDGIMSCVQQIKTNGE